MYYAIFDERGTPVKKIILTSDADNAKDKAKQIAKYHNWTFVQLLDMTKEQKEKEIKRLKV